MKRLLKIVLGAVLGLVVLVGGAFVAAALFLDLDKVINAQIAQQKPELEKKLGRQITVGKVSTEIFPTLGGKIDGISIAPDPAHKEDDRPLLQVGQVGFEVALWDALVSLGKDIRVKTVYVDGLKVNLVRYPDGTLSYQDILDRQPKPAPAEEEKPSEPLSPELQERLKALSIGEIRLGDAELRLVDHATPTHQVAESFVKHLNVKLNDVRLSDPIKLHVDAAIFADAKNFEFDTEVGPLPADLQVKGTPPVGATSIKMTNVDLARLAPYLGKAVPARIDSADADADLKLSGLRENKPSELKGYFQIQHIQIAGGQKFDFRIDSDLKADLQKLGVEVAKLKVQIGQIEIAMSGDLHDLATHPTFHDFTVRSTTLSPGLIFAYYPPAKDGLPPGFKLDGAASLDVTASGDASHQKLNANLDLANLDIYAPGSLAKPKGVAMGLKVDGEFTSSDANLHKAEVILDELDLAASGTVKNFAQPQLDLALNAPPFSFDQLARLMPSLREALQKQNATAQGQGRIDGHVKGAMTNLDALLELALTGVHMDAAGTKLDGNLSLRAAAKGDPNQNMQAEVVIDGQQATMVIPGTVNKLPTTPMRLEMQVSRTPTNIDVKKFEVRFAELAMQANGTFDMGKGQTQLRVDVAPLDIEKFAKTVTAIPAEKAKGGLADVKVAVKGDPNKLETMSVSIDPLNVRYGDSDLRGVMNVSNLVKPDVTMKVTSNKLDLDTLLSLDDSPKEKKKREEVDDPKLKEITFVGNFQAKEMIYSKTQLTNFNGVVKLKDGLLTLEDATFGVFGGSVSAKGTTAEIWKGKMPFHAKLAVKQIDVAQALAAKTKYGGLMQGRGDFNVDLSGEGFESADLEKALTGNMDASLTNAKYNSASLTQSVLGGFAPTLSKIPGTKLAQTQADNAISDLIAAFEVKQGKMQLKKPMAMGLDGSRVTLDGAIGIAGGLFLTGTYGLAGNVLTQATGGKCKVTSEVPIPVKINGTASKPSFAPDVGGAAKNVATACLTGAVGGAAVQAAEQAKAEAEAKAKAAAAQAQAQAQAAAKAQADNAKAQAQAAADAQKKAAADAAAKAKADADAQAKKAADDAKKKAQDALGGIHF